MDDFELKVFDQLTGKLVTFKRGDAGLTVKGTNDRPDAEVVYRQVVSASFTPEPGTAEVVYLSKKKGGLGLVVVKGKVQNANETAAEKASMSGWVERLMNDVYEGSGVKRSRRLKVIVNPYSGMKRGAAIFRETIEPILRHARCILDITYTTHSGHGRKIAQELTLDNYDAVVTISGDGLVHEVLNGFSQHEDPRKALSIPIAPIPTGSGNGLSCNILGRDRGFDVVDATLNAIKGKPMRVDVFSLTQDGHRSISFMSQALGLVADADLGTENMRWMGDTRFLVGVLRGILLFRSCPIQLSYKLAEDDKVKMAENALAQRARVQQGLVNPPSNASGNLPPLQYLPDEVEGWVTCEEPILFLYAGKGPYVGRDLMAFPASVPNDGLIDLTTMSVKSRLAVISHMGGAEKGDNYWNPEFRYVKARAYRVKPLSRKGFFSVDGEFFPFKEFQVEVHQELATLLSPYGHYAVDFPSGTQMWSSNDRK